MPPATAAADSVLAWQPIRQALPLGQSARCNRLMQLNKLDEHNRPDKANKVNKADSQPLSTASLPEEPTPPAGCLVPLV